MFNNAKATVPTLFQSIIDSDNRRAELKAQPVIGFDDWKELVEDRASLRRDAEVACRRSNGDGSGRAR